jgi:hypothetical protein
MSEVYTGVGTLSNEKTVILDEPLRLPPGRVRVIVEPLVGKTPGDDLIGILNAIRQSLRESGYRFRTKEEIDAQIRSERESWERQ